MSDRCGLKLNPEISIPTPKFKIGQKIFNLVGDEYDWYVGYVLGIALSFSSAELTYTLSCEKGVDKIPNVSCHDVDWRSTFTGDVAY